MRTLVGLVVLVGALSAVVFAVARRTPAAAGEPPQVTLGEVPRIFAALTSTATNGSFAVFLFGAGGQPPAPMDALNVQFSKEGGRLGIDWVLLAPLNVESQTRFVEFFERKGRSVLRREGNGVRYLRVEGHQLPELAQEFLVAEFRVSREQKMNLIAEGFVWAG